MNEVLGAAMSNAADDLTADQRLQYGHRLLKSYVLELDAAAREDWRGTLAERSLDIEPGEDDALAVLSINGSRVFADRIEDRFVLVHSLVAAQESDRLIDRVSDGKNIDRIWLGSQTLESIAHWGTFRGFGSRFDRKLDREEENQAGDEQDAEADADEAPDAPISSLSIRLSGSQAPYLLNVLSEHPLLRHSIALSSVRLRYRAEEELSIADEVFFHGKVTARGDSYELHRDLMGKIVDSYADRLSTIEDVASFQLSEEGHLSGSTVIAALNGETDVAAIVRTVFSGTKPFRIAGIPRKLADDYVSVQGVDLHSGASIDFDVAPEMIRMYVPRGVCGNTLLRFETNLQQCFDAAVRLELGSTGELI